MKMSLPLNYALSHPLRNLKKSIDVAELYLSYEDGPNSDEMYSLIQRIQTLVLANPLKQQQTNIKDYFKS